MYCPVNKTNRLGNWQCIGPVSTTALSDATPTLFTVIDRTPCCGAADEPVVVVAKQALCITASKQVLNCHTDHQKQAVRKPKVAQAKSARLNIDINTAVRDDDDYAGKLQFQLNELQHRRNA